jgi:hypothetical protein
VIHFFWDRVLGTYRRPDAGQTQADVTLRIGGPDRFPPFEANSSGLISNCDPQTKMETPCTGPIFSALR